jgi:predicted secreted protein
MFDDERSGKIALIAHCILNQNSRAAGLAERPSMITEILKFLANNEIGIIQLPCPELAYAGALRAPQIKSQYNNTTFRRQCKRIAQEIADQIRQYEEHEIRLKLVIGVDGSPSCSVHNSGIFMEKLRLALNKRGITAPFYDIHYKSLNKDIMKMKKLIE